MRAMTVSDRLSVCGGSEFGGLQQMNINIRGNFLVSKKIFTEEPELELWRNLLRYSYKSNIKRYFEEHSIPVRIDNQSENNFDVLANAIAGAMLQADEYYKASKTVSLHVEPLMLYYGTSNLLYAITILTSGKKAAVENHGMTIELDPNAQYIADTKVKFFSTSKGGVHVFAKGLGFDKDLCQYAQSGPEGNDCWRFSDYLDSIAEICDDFDRCYPERNSRILMLDVVNTSDGIVEKVQINGARTAEISASDIEGFSTAYLRPTIGRSREGKEHIVLRHKINGKKIEQISYSGQPYLRIAHKVGDKKITIPEELNMYISLFILGNLCRYHPDKWYPFVTQDSTGEKLLVEKLLYFSRRIIPNIVLNRIEDEQITFVSDKYVPDDRVKLVGEHEVKEMVKAEVEKQIRHQQITDTVRLRKQ